MTQHVEVATVGGRWLLEVQAGFPLVTQWILGGHGVVVTVHLPGGVLRRSVERFGQRVA